MRYSNTLSGLFILVLLVLAGTLMSCSSSIFDAPDEVYDGYHWYIREVTKGEIVPEEGPHQHFEIFGEPTTLHFDGESFSLAFELPDGRTRQVFFQVIQEDPLAFEVRCPLKNLEPNADSLLWEDRRLNEAISEHNSVKASFNGWTTFFNDRMSGVFSSDWQLWWGDVSPDPLHD